MPSAAREGFSINVTRDAMPKAATWLSLNLGQSTIFMELVQCALFASNIEAL